jgi:hypothetical protein
MRSGIARTDEDRWPWLHAIAAWIGEIRRSGGRKVVSCSAEAAPAQRTAAAHENQEQTHQLAARTRGAAHGAESVLVVMISLKDGQEVFEPALAV